MIRKILRLFVNPLTADDKYSLLNTGNLLQNFQMPLSQKRKIFFDFFPFYKFRYNFQYFQKKDDLIAYVLLNLQTPKNVFGQMSKKSLYF